MSFVIGDLGAVRHNLLLEQIAIVGEKCGLSDDSGIIEFADIGLVDVGEEGRQIITGRVIRLELRIEIRP